jgi:hypothetical protein
LDIISTIYDVAEFSKEIHQINSYLNQSLTFTRRFDKGGWEGGRYYGTCAHALKGEEHTWNYKKGKNQG